MCSSVTKLYPCFEMTDNNFVDHVFDAQDRFISACNAKHTNIRINVSNVTNTVFRQTDAKGHDFRESS